MWLSIIIIRRRRSGITTKQNPAKENTKGNKRNGKKRKQGSERMFEVKALTWLQYFSILNYSNVDSFHPSDAAA